MTSNTLDKSLEDDVEIINSISIVSEILGLVSKMTGLGFVAIARVTDQKWITCKALDTIDFGLKPGDELVLETTICNEIRNHSNPVIIDDVSKDELYVNHPTPLQYGFKSYISYPIFKKDGSFFGTLCGIDPEPAVLSTEEIKTSFKLFTELISFHIESEEKMRATELELEEETIRSTLRETFIAVLGHDLRNPLSSISMSSAIIELYDDLPEEVVKCNAIIESAAKRIDGIVENVLDFSKGNQGKGIEVNRVDNSDELEKAFLQVIEEISIVNRDINLSVELNFKSEFYSDSNRLAQILSNLITNAIKYGDATKPIIITAGSDSKNINLQVENKGDTIPKSIKEKIFLPYFTINKENHKKGLGLGLFISSEIAKAHQGKLTVESDESSTVFKLTFPVIQQKVGEKK